MYKRIAKVLLPLVVLAAVAALTIGSSCCTPSLTLPSFTIG